MKRGAGIVVLMVVLVIGVPTANVAAEGLDVTVKSPTIIFMGTQINLSALQAELDALETELETDEDLQNFTDQQDLTRAFANAGAAATHLATQRSFSDYRAF